MTVSPVFTLFLGLAAAVAAESAGCAAHASVAIPDHGADKDIVLLQTRSSHRTWMAQEGPVHWVSDDPEFDEDFAQDDQPGGPDSAAEATPSTTASSPVSPPTTPASNVTAMQIRGQNGADPATTTAAPAGATTTAAAAAAANGTAAGNATATTAAPSANSTTEAANATANATGCATRKDPRIQAWFVDTAPEGTPCVFGVDARDEGSHCIFEGGQYGSNGFCYTNKEGSAWGSCNELCPLYGTPAALGNKIDKVVKSLGAIVHKLGGDSEDAASDNPADAKESGSADKANEGSKDGKEKKPEASQGDEKKAPAAKKKSF